jgi:hypothetical protein
MVLLTLPETTEDTEPLHDMLFRLGFHKPPYNYVHILSKLIAVRKCSRSGCRQYFQECDGTVCYYHPGRKGSRLSCCGAHSFNHPGCKRAPYHDGQFFDHATSVDEENQDPESTLRAEGEACWGGHRYNRK